MLFHEANREIQIFNKEDRGFLIEKQEFPVRKTELSIRKVGVFNKEIEKPSEENHQALRAEDTGVLPCCRSNRMPGARRETGQSTRV
jgi:hypothetical protein